MATRSIPLPAAVWQPTSDDTGWASARLQIKQSSAALPSPRWLEWLFDDSVDEFIVTSFVLPNNYSGSPVLKVYYKAASGTTGTAAFQARVAAVSDGDAQDVDAKAFATPNQGTGTVPATTGYLDVINISLTNDDNMAAGDFIVIALSRDVSADSVTGDIEVVGCEFRFDE